MTFLYFYTGTISPDDVCVLRTCNQLIIGRSLRYGRALAIINQEEYLREVGKIKKIIEFD